MTSRSTAQAILRLSVSPVLCRRYVRCPAMRSRPRSRRSVRFRPNNLRPLSSPAAALAPKPLYLGNSPYIYLFDLTKSLAGRLRRKFTRFGDRRRSRPLIVRSWEDSTIVLGGFSGAWGESNWTLDMGDQEQEIYVWNAQSGNGPAIITTSVATCSSLALSPRSINVWPGRR